MSVYVKLLQTLLHIHWTILLADAIMHLG